MLVAFLWGALGCPSDLRAQDGDGIEQGSGKTRKKKRPQLSKEEARARFKELARSFGTEQQLAIHERFKTIGALGKLGTIDAHRFLIENCEREKDSDSPEFIWAYCRALSRYPSRNSVAYLLTHGLAILDKPFYPALTARLTPLTGVEHMETIEWLVGKGWKHLPELDLDAQMVFLKVLVGTGDPRLTRPAHKFLGDRRFEPDIQIEFIRILRRHSQHTERKIKERAAKKVARAYKRTRDRELKVEALLALEALAAAEYSDLFVDALKDDWWQVRSVVIDIMVSTHQQELGSFIAPLLKDPVPSVQVAAVAALRELGGADVIPPLIDALDKNVGRVADDIGDALVWLTGVDFGVDAVGWRHWWDDNKEQVPIKGITQEQFDRIKAQEEKSATGTYYGLRIISKYVIFIIDTSASMDHKYRVNVGDIGKGDGSGRTEVKKKNRRRKKKKTGKWMKKIEVARLELVRALSHLPNGTMFNIIRFSGDFSSWQTSLIRMVEHVRNESIVYAETVGSGGMTNVHDTLLEALKDPDVNTIYFLSDGAPTAGLVTDPKKILETICELNRARKVKIHTIGFHLDPVAKELMKNLAAQNFGRFIDR